MYRHFVAPYTGDAGDWCADRREETVLRFSVILSRQKDRKKLLPQRDRSFICGGKWGASDGSLYFAGTQAAGAGVDTAGSTVYNCLYSSDIGLPGTVRTAMGVRNLDTESDALTTNFAFCHLSAPPYRAI